MLPDSPRIDVNNRVIYFLFNKRRQNIKLDSDSASESDLQPGGRHIGQKSIHRTAQTWMARPSIRSEKNLQTNWNSKCE